MKRFFWISFVVILLFGCTAFAGSGELAVKGDFTAIAAHGDTVYLLDGENNLFIVQAGQAFPDAPACTLARDADFLMVDQGVLYGWEPIADVLFRIDVVTGAASEERAVGIADVFDLRDGYSECEFYAPVLHEGMLTVYWAGEFSKQGIVRFAPDGTHTSYGLAGDGTLLSGDPDGRILVVPDWCGEKELGQLDEQEGSFTWIRMLPLDTWGIASYGEKVYIGAGNYIEEYASLEAADGQIAACLPETAISVGNQSMKIVDGEWVALIDYGTFYLRHLDIHRSTRELTLPPELYSPWDSNATFLGEHPDVALRFANWWMWGPSTGEEYQEAIENLEADILHCFVDYTSWQALKEEGYTADLSASAVLQQTIEGMYSAFHDVCMQDGRAIGIPFASYIGKTTLQINREALLEETGLTEDQLPKTFLELPEALSRSMAQDTQTGIDGEPLDKSAAKMLCEAFMEQYIAYYESRGEPLVFDTPLFRAGLALRDDVPALPSIIEESGWCNMVRYSGERMYVDQMPSILPLPLDAEHPYTLPITLGLLFVNPNSPNMDLAIAYLEGAVQNMPPEEQVFWMPGDWQPVPNPGYEATLLAYAERIELLRAKAEAFADDEHSWSGRNLYWLEASAARFAQDGRWLVSPDFLQFYALIAEHMVVYEQDFFGTSSHPAFYVRNAGALRKQYVNGKIDADALIEGLQRIADMRWAEGEAE